MRGRGAPSLIYGFLNGLTDLLAGWSLSQVVACPDREGQEGGAAVGIGGKWDDPDLSTDGENSRCRRSGQDSRLSAAPFRVETVLTQLGAVVGGVSGG
jgi:hypothetical protein